MIDDKGIEEAARLDDKEYYDRLSDNDRCFFEYGFRRGYNQALKAKFPKYDVKYDNRDLFAYHHVLTGSCRMGRESFVSDKGLSLDDKTSVREFVELTKNAYGGNIIKKLPSAYGISN